MTEIVVLESYSTINNLTSNKKRHSFRKFFQWNSEKYNKNDETVEKINSIYKANNSTTLESKKTKKLKKFLSFSRKNKQHFNDAVTDDYEIVKDNSIRFSLKRTLSRLKNKKNNTFDTKEFKLSSDDINLDNKDALECYNKFKSNHSIKTKNYDVPPSLKSLDFNNKVNTVDNMNLKRRGSLNKKKTILGIGGDNPSTNLDPFSPLIEDTNTLLEPFENIEFEKDDAFDKENAISFPKLSSINNTRQLEEFTKEVKNPNRFAEENLQMLLSGSCKENFANLETNIDVSVSSNFNEDKVISITDIEQSPQSSDAIHPCTLSNDEINSSETLKETETFTNYEELPKQENIPDNPEEDVNVKCLAIPTFRDDNVIALDDYIKGHKLGKLTQLEILEHLQKEKINESELIDKIKDTFDDFRNPSFYNENTDDDYHFYSCNDSYDHSSVNQTIRSIGASKNKDSSKLKFNLLSEVFYYDNNVESKGSKNLSILETAKKELNTEKATNPLLQFKDDENLMLNSNSTDVSPLDSNNVLDLSQLDNIKHLLSIGSRNNDKIKITNNNHFTYNWGSSDLYENSDLTIDTIKKIAMNLSSDEALEHLSQFNFPYKMQMCTDLQVDSCLADVESLGSPNLTLPDYNDVLPNGYFPEISTGLENHEIKSSGDTMAELNEDFIKLSPQAKEEETASIRSILKKKVNQNESIELQSLFNLTKDDDFTVEMPQMPDSNLQKMRIDQLKRFYTTDFYPDLENDEDYVRSLRSTQSKYNTDLYV
ncbi:hypothetical protein ACO0R3_000884 [Hanseniaspora guilliermondii]